MGTPSAMTYVKTLEFVFGRHVRSLRNARGFTQAVLADRAGLSEDTIRRLEHGTFSPSLRTINLVALGLDLPLLTLFESLNAGRPVDPDLELLLGLLRANPELPVPAITALVRRLLDAVDQGTGA